jgi:hypothetical protein
MCTQHALPIAPTLEFVSAHFTRRCCLTRPAQELVKPHFDCNVVFSANPDFLREDKGLASLTLSPTGSPVCGAHTPSSPHAQQCPFKF